MRAFKLELKGKSTRNGRRLGAERHLRTRDELRHYGYFSPFVEASNVMQTDATVTYASATRTGMANATDVTLVPSSE